MNAQEAIEKAQALGLGINDSAYFGPGEQFIEIRRSTRSAPNKASYAVHCKRKGLIGKARDMPVYTFQEYKW